MMCHSLCGALHLVGLRWFDMEIVVKFCKLIIFASKLGTSKMFLQSNAQSLQILLIPIT